MIGNDFDTYPFSVGPQLGAGFGVEFFTAVCTIRIMIRADQIGNLVEYLVPS
jgi:hypothetical protein